MTAQNTAWEKARETAKLIIDRWNTGNAQPIDIMIADAIEAAERKAWNAALIAALDELKFLYGDDAESLEGFNNIRKLTK